MKTASTKIKELDNRIDARLRNIEAQIRLLFQETELKEKVICRCFKGAQCGCFTSKEGQAYEARLRAASARSDAQFTIGQRVQFFPVKYTHPENYIWYGLVIPRPADIRCREFGKKGLRLIWVLTEYNQVRGVYPGNLRRM